ncbi:MAG: glycosyltransferase family 39 protein [Myxococcales bacterium]|nr:glycosyltransferase family 39 protein [Myxococcales bacterium]
MSAPKGWRALAALALLKLALSLALLASGFHGVSDDDFARIVISQEFAHAPKLDPSGTSWLPLPFWITGALMMAFGLSPAVAVGVGVALGVVSVWLVYAAARRLTDDDTTAFWAAALAAVLPWSARLGASAVPELPVAACSLYALTTLLPARLPLSGTERGPGGEESTETNGRARIIGAILLLAASLSRYEPWFLAGGFALFCLWDASKSRAARAANVLAAALALLGPVVWSIWNAHAHGSPTHYLDRVAAYKQAIDQGAIAERLTAYFLAVFRAEPELMAAGALLTWVARGALRTELRRWSRPVILLVVLLVTLTVSSVKGGAPTHHPERALLALHLFVAIVVGHAAVLASRAELLQPKHVVIALLVLGGGIASLRATLLFKESVADRRAELAVGREVASQVPAGERVFLEVVDYGYFAVLAASERPWDFELSGKVDPARGGEALGEAEVKARAHAAGIRTVVVRDRGGAWHIVAAP